MADNQYPEHDKLTEIADQSHAVGQFLDEFLPSKGYVLAYVPEQYDHTLVPVQRTINSLLAEYFEIDQDKIEAEKRAMLDSLRKIQGTPS